MAIALSDREKTALPLCGLSYDQQLVRTSVARPRTLLGQQLYPVFVQDWNRSIHHDSSNGSHEM